jgi:putative NADH-flavin reductase
MKIALCGATGKTGSRIMKELLTRGHQVLAIVRAPAALLPEGVKEAVDDLSDAMRTAETIKGMDALISAYAPPLQDPDELVHVTKRLVDATEQGGVPRFLMVGGAGSLEVTPGMTLIDSGKLPPEWLSIATAHSRALEVLRASDVKWTSLSPAAYFGPGVRTGHFRLGADNLIADRNGDSRISMEDYAIAMVDELENPQHSRARFSIGY